MVNKATTEKREREHNFIEAETTMLLNEFKSQKKDRIFGRHSSDVTSKSYTSPLAFYEADGTLHSWVLLGVSDIKVCLLCSLWVWKGE